MSERGWAIFWGCMTCVVMLFVAILVRSCQEHELRMKQIDPNYKAFSERTR